MAERKCGSCTLCCKIMAIAELGKPANQWCSHCDAKKGCAIYDRKPGECTAFTCAWLMDERLGPEWQPSKSKIVLVPDVTNNRLVAYVDPATPGAWKRNPYYEWLRQQMFNGLRHGEQVLVSIADKSIMLLPEGELAMDSLGEDDVVEVQTITKPMGDEYRTVIRKKPASGKLP